MQTLERRLDLLRLEGKGFNRREVVKELSQKFSVTEQTVYNDYASRNEWQPKVSDLIGSTNILMKIANRYEQIYRDLSFKALQTENESVWLGCQNSKAKVNQMLAEIAVIPEILGRLAILEEQAKKRMLNP